MRFSDNLRNLRIQRQLTQMKLAEGLGTSQSAIAAWENSTREPDFRTIQRIAEYFHVPMSTLLPYQDDLDEAYVNSVAEALQRNEKLKTIFDIVKNFSENDLDVLITVANSISGKRE